MLIVCHPPSIDSEKTYINVINGLVKRGLDVKAKNVYGETALHFAARYRNVTATKQLISLGAVCTALTVLTDATPAHYLLRRTASKMVTTLELVMLVEIFSDQPTPIMDKPDVSGVTPEHLCQDLGISLDHIGFAFGRNENLKVQKNIL